MQVVTCVAYTLFSINEIKKFFMWLNCVFCIVHFPYQSLLMAFH